MIFRTTGNNAIAADSSTLPGAFPFGKWVSVVVTADIPGKKVRIFIDGVEMELPESEIAEGVNTSASDLGDLRKLTEENLAKINDKELDPSEVPEMTEDLDEILEKIAEEMEEVQENDSARHEMSNAAEDINDAKDALAGLDAKTDMEEMNDTSSSDAEKEYDKGENTASAGAEKNGSGSGEEKDAAGMYKEAEGLEKEIAAAKSDMDAAGEAVSQNTSFADAKKKALSTTPSRPDLASALGGGPPGYRRRAERFPRQPQPGPKRNAGHERPRRCRTWTQRPEEPRGIFLRILGSQVVRRRDDFEIRPGRQYDRLRKPGRQWRLHGNAHGRIRGTARQ